MPQYTVNDIALEAELLTLPGHTPGGQGSSGQQPGEVNGHKVELVHGFDIPVLLVMGLGMQLIDWPERFVNGLLAQGHPVIRFDNRDVGLSTRDADWGKPDLSTVAMRHALGLRVQAPYTLYDMVADTVGLLDALAVRKVHLVGVSMGGMIGQLLAALHPRRVASFSCIMSSSGARHLPGPESAAQRVVFEPFDSKDLEMAVNHLVEVRKVIGSPHYPTPEEVLRAQVTASVQRSHHPLGALRQSVAIAAGGDRSRLLRDIAAPTCVLHGSHDPLVPVAAAHDLVEKIPGAELTIFDGMGHDLPEALLPDLLSEIEATITRAAQLP